MPSGENEPQLKKKKIKKAKFCDKWIADGSPFVTWLHRVPTDATKFACSVCNRQFTGGLTAVRQHARSKHHNRKVEFPNEESEKVKNKKREAELKIKVKTAEIRYAAFFAEHNLSLWLSGPLLELIKGFGEDPEVLKRMKCCASKCTGIINQVLCVRETDRLTNNLISNKFSVYVDKRMSLMVRYVDPLNLHVNTQLLQLHLDSKKSSATQLVDQFQEELTSKKIPLTNVAAVSCNNASVMVAENDSFQSHLATKHENILTIPCVCHAVALAANDACEQMPSDCEQLLKGTSDYFNQNNKHAIAKEFLDNSKKNSLQISKLNDNHWLARYQCVKLILKHWKKLKEFFAQQWTNERASAVKELYDLMNNKSMKAYFLFLDNAFNVLNTYNNLFQGHETMIHQLQPSSADLVQTFLSRCLKVSLLCPGQLRNMRLSSSSIILPAESIDLGEQCEAYLNKPTNGLLEENIVTIRKNCLSFYITLCEELIKRLPYDDGFLKDVSVFQAETALMQDDRATTFDSVLHVNERLGGFNEEELKSEWSSLFDGVSVEEKTTWKDLDFDSMWRSIGLVMDETGCRRFPLLTSLMNVVRSLPHSNIEAERTFSRIVDTRTKKRNQLDGTTVKSLGVVKSMLKAKGITAKDLIIDDTYLQLMKSRVLYLKRCNPPS